MPSSHARGVASPSSTGRPARSRPVSRPGFAGCSLLYPDAFLGLVEQGALMPALTRVVLDLALDQVDAAFYYAGTGETVFSDVPGDAPLARLLESIPT